MIDTDLMSVWAWDARPFPDFPSRNSVWSDGENWQTGHWLTGRMGLMPISYIAEDLSQQAGLQNLDVTGLNGVVQGYHIDRPMSARAALTPLMDILNLELSESGGNVVFRSPNNAAIKVLDDSYFAQNLISPILFGKGNPDQALRDVRIHFIDISNDYQLGSISARDRAAETVRITDLRLPIVMDQNYASFLAAQQLETHHLSMQTLSLNLSPLTALSFQVGDKTSLNDYEGLWRLDSLDAGETVNLSLTRIPELTRIQSFGNTPTQSTYPVFLGRPSCFAFDISGPYQGPLLGAIMTPFETTEITGGAQSVTANIELRLGALVSDLKTGPVGRWDRANQFDIYMPNSRFSALEDTALLNGANKFAVETDSGWEVLQIRDMALIGPDTYTCKMLLRGLDGSAADMMKTIKSGARVVWLDRGVFDGPLSAELLQENLTFTCDVNGRSGDAAQLTYIGRHLRPLAPVHLKSEQTQTGLSLSWIRQTRVGGDSWAGEVPLGETEERYLLRFFNVQVLILETETQQPFYSGIVQGAGRVEISQYSNVYGWGSAARLSL